MYFPYLFLLLQGWFLLGAALFSSKQAVILVSLFCLPPILSYILYFVDIKDTPKVSWDTIHKIFPPTPTPVTIIRDKVSLFSRCYQNIQDWQLYTDLLS